MYRVALSAAVVSLSALPAMAQDCSFATECYESEPCQDTSFSLTTMLDEAKLITDFGDLIVVGVKSEDRVTTVFATGDGAEYLLSRNGDVARSITYMGTCEGEF